jgi:lipoprotein-anchoring transpeptidase ErfK/SrfK
VSVVRRIVISILAAAGAVLLASGCGAGDGTAADRPAPATGASPETTTAGATAAETAIAPELSVVAAAKGELSVYSTANAAVASLVLPAHTALGSQTVVLVLGTPVADRVEVSLPIRPNGSTGWVALGDVTLHTVDEKVVVDLAGRSLTVYRGDEVLLTTPVAIGSEENPTPTGSFFVTDRVRSLDPVYGDRAYGLSGRSTSLSEFAGGDGQIGIHGTNNPGSIGQAVSHGCIRVPNEVALQLESLLLPGTPVVVRDA